MHKKAACKPFTGRFYHVSNTFKNHTTLFYFYALYALHQAAQHAAAMFKIIIAELWPVVGFGVNE